MHFAQLFLVSSLLAGAACPAQVAPTTPAAALGKARALYYTPVDAGLQGFHCEVSFDWKSFLQKATNQDVPETDTRLGYLRSIKLTVDDDLHGTGQLRWNATTTAPEGTEEPIERMRSGIQQMWTGFFQTWNGFYTGEVLAAGDSKAVVEKTATGYRVAVHDGPGTAEQQYDDKLLLQTIHVSTPTLDSVTSPTFSETPQGRLVTVLRSVYKQPPSAVPVQIDMTVHYAPVGGFQIPSELLIDVAGTASFDFHLSGCTVKTQLTPKQP